MATGTPINGWDLPELSDANPTVEDLNAWAIDADFYAFTRVATTSARDAIFPSGMPPGTVIFCEDTGEFYQDITGDGIYISWIPRKFVLTETITVPAAHPTSPQELFEITLEDNSFYQIRGYIDFEMPANDHLVLGWTFSSAVDLSESRMVIDFQDNEAWDIDYAEIATSTSDRRLEWFKYCRIGTINATTATLNAWKVFDTGGDGTIHPFGTYIEVWKTGGG